MIKAFLWSLLIPLLALSDSNRPFFENEDPAIFHHVNVITGNLNISFEDVLVEGAQSIPIFRTYSSSGALERSSNNFDLILEGIREGWLIQGGWNLLPHANLLLDPSYNRKEFKAYVSAPNGSQVSYSYSHKQEGAKHVIFLKPTQSANQVSGKLSSRTNAQNNLLQLDLKRGIAILFLPDGGRRTYRGPSLHEELHGKRFYLVENEKLPSGHQLSYVHEEDTRRLKRIESKNPAGHKVFAWVDIDYVTLGKHKPFELTFRTSDGKWLQYKTIRHENRIYISEMLGNCRPHEQFHLHPGRKGIGARLESIDLGGQEIFSVQYYLPSTIRQERKWADKGDITKASNGSA